MELKRQKTPEQALATLERLSARAEKCTDDAVRLLRKWNIESKEWASILDSLHKNRFIDDQRYAGAFIREKTGLSNWGPQKIRAALINKRIDEKLIDSQMKLFFTQNSVERLKPLLEKKLLSIREDDPRKLREKLVRFALSKGYEIADVLSCLETILG